MLVFIISVLIPFLTNLVWERHFLSFLSIISLHPLIIVILSRMRWYVCLFCNFLCNLGCAFAGGLLCHLIKEKPMFLHRIMLNLNWGEFIFWNFFLYPWTWYTSYRLSEMYYWFAKDLWKIWIVKHYSWISGFLFLFCPKIDFSLNSYFSVRVLCSTLILCSGTLGTLGITMTFQWDVALQVSWCWCINRKVRRGERTTFLFLSA